MIEAKASRVTVDGNDFLRLDVGDKGVDIRLPTDVSGIEAAASVLMMNLAGIHQAGIESAAIMNLIEHGGFER